MLVLRLFGKDQQAFLMLPAKPFEMAVMKRSRRMDNVRTYALYINPHIMFSGSKDDINETLKTMFKKAMKKQVLKNMPIKLF